MCSTTLEGMTHIQVCENATPPPKKIHASEAVQYTNYTTLHGSHEYQFNVSVLYN